MRRAAVVALTVVLALSGCVTVPTSGPVERHSPVQQQANPGVDIAPVPPAPGASPGLIVEGFLHAMATYQPGYAVARQFLTTGAAQAWQPESGVEIYAAGYPPQASDSGVVLTAPLAGTLDPQGSFTVGGTVYHHDFGLVRDAESQWRISRPPRGLLVSQSLFGSTWVRADVCLWDVTGNWLVPDPRFVQIGKPRLAATVRAVLGGPSSLASAAYRRPVTGLQASAVALGSGGVVTVDIAGATDTLDMDGRRRLAAELVWSLTSLKGVTGVRVRSHGVSWELGGRDGVLTTAEFAEGAPVPANPDDGVYLLRQGTVQRAAWADPTASPRPLPGAGAPPRALAVRTDGEVVALVTDDGTEVRSVVVRDGVTKVELTGERATGVRWTRQGELWALLDRTRGRRLRAVKDDQEVPVSTEGLPIGQIRSFAPAPDGVRVALVIENQGRTSLGVAAVVRTSAGFRFVGWRELAPSAWAPTGQAPIDVGWTGPAGLLVLVGGSSSARVINVDSEGAVATEVRPNDATALVQLVAASSGRAVLRGPDGQTWRFVGGLTWEPWLNQVDAVALP
ncbi:MAG: LpqB family beta-propeller domain-containing protein [Micropruina sp.]|uniref:LpqB family beta-propeller domain-containing protein n=1 Tax=Micropruina sp. TaxID=2737536 RepID=UPI0039E52C59